MFSVPNLTSKGTVSCGCINRQNHINKLLSRRFVAGEIPQSMWTKIINNAKARSKDFNVTADYAWQIYVNQQGVCALTGLSMKLPTRDKEVATASLDRIDSNIGYEEGNLQWVHKDANQMKMDLPEDRFIEICRAIVAHADHKTNLLCQAA